MTTRRSPTMLPLARASFSLAAKSSGMERVIGSPDECVSLALSGNCAAAVSQFASRDLTSARSRNDVRSEGSLV